MIFDQTVSILIILSVIGATETLNFMVSTIFLEVIPFITVLFVIKLTTICWSKQQTLVLNKPIYYFGDPFHIDALDIIEASLYKRGYKPRIYNEYSGVGSNPSSIITEQDAEASEALAKKIMSEEKPFSLPGVEKLSISDFITPIILRISQEKDVDPVVAMYLLVGVIQRGGLTTNASPDVMYKLEKELPETSYIPGGVILTSRELVNSILALKPTNVHMNTHLQQFSWTLSSTVFYLAKNLEEEGYLARKMRLEYPELRKQDALWCASFQRLNPSCPIHIRWWLDKSLNDYILKNYPNTFGYNLLKKHLTKKNEIVEIKKLPLIGGPQGVSDVFIERVQKNISDLKKVDPLTASYLITGLIQRGGLKKGAPNNITYTLKGVTLTSNELLTTLENYSASNTNKNIGFSFCWTLRDSIAQKAKILGEEGYLAERMRYHYPSLSKEDAIWCSSFQRMNPNCPLYVRNWLTESLNDYLKRS